MPFFRLILVLIAFSASACAEPFPHDEEAIWGECHPLTHSEISPYPSDPHDGFKEVFACGLEPDELGVLPYPDDTLIVKFSRKAHHDFPYLVATAEKRGGVWEWAEYTRNFEDEAFLKLPIPESVCTDCHQSVADSLDWIFTLPESS